MSSDSFNQFDPDSHIPSLVSEPKRNLALSMVHPPSSYLSQVVKVDLNESIADKDKTKILFETSSNQLSQVCSTYGGKETLCLTNDGKILMLSDDEQDEKMEKKLYHVEALTVL